MIGLLCFVLAILASPFKSKLRLEAENAVLRHAHLDELLPVAKLDRLSRDVAFASGLMALLLDIHTELENARSRAQCQLAHGFKRDFSIVTNATAHRNKRYVFNADLK